MAAARRRLLQQRLAIVGGTKLVIRGRVEVEALRSVIVALEGETMIPSAVRIFVCMEPQDMRRPLIRAYIRAYRAPPMDADPDSEQQRVSLIAPERPQGPHPRVAIED